MTRRIRLGLVVTLATALSACTTVGLHTGTRSKIDFGGPMVLQVCVLRAPGVSEQRANELMTVVSKELTLYNIEVFVPWTRPWTRSGFTAYAMFDDLGRRDIEPPCDRLLALVDRNVADVLWGLASLPEILGAVDEITHTHGMVVAVAVTEAQLDITPEEAAVHEFYHMLGCPHALTLTKCYELIAKLKRHAAPEMDFVPGISQTGELLYTREAVNEVLRKALVEDDAKRRAAPSNASNAPAGNPASSK
jgi:hypothetical protein